MLVFHGIWARGALCLWAEDARLPARIAEPVDGPPPARRSRAPRPHPFAAGQETIAAALASLGGVAADAAGQAAADELAVWLPSAPDGPQAAPELIRPAAAADAASRARWAALGCWRVPALAIEPAAALGVLAALDRLAAPGAALAAVAAQATGAAGERAGELAAAGELGPGGRWRTGPRWPGSLMTWPAGAGCCPPWSRPATARSGPAGGADHPDGAWAARWYPVLTGHDARRAAEFADAMPPLCRAAQPGGEPPAPILDAALAGLTDAAARARLAAGLPGWALLPPRRGRRPAHVPVTERWAAALAGPDPHVMVDAAGGETAAALATALAEWRAAAGAPAGPVRTCFRLVEPAAGADQTAAAAGQRRPRHGVGGIGARCGRRPGVGGTGVGRTGRWAGHAVASRVRSAVHGGSEPDAARR